MDEPDFVDARPETDRLSAAAEPLEDDGDELVFYDAAADSGLDIQVVAPGSSEAPERGSRARELAELAEEVGGLSASMLASAEQWAQRDRDPQRIAERVAALQAAAQLPAENDPYLGKELGPFRVETFLHVERGLRRYLAVASERQEVCLLEVYPLRGTYGEEFARLAERAERACRVKHPLLALNLGVGRTKECFFVGREILVGPTLRELLAGGERFSPEEVQRILRAAAQALKALHGRDLYHGDVSLDAIVREKEGLYLLVGAGLARARPEYAFLSGGGEVLGTPGFVAPEVVDRGRGSPAADIYSLGCVAYALLAGRPPFVGEDPVQVLMDQLNGEVPSLRDPEGLEVDAGLATVVTKLTGYTPETRYARLAELEDDLRSLREGKAIRPFPEPTLQDPFAEAPQKQLDAGTLLLVLLFVLDLALAASAGLTWHKAQQLPLEDPLLGFELPLPGVSAGGYGNTGLTVPQRGMDSPSPKAPEDAPH